MARRIDVADIVGGLILVAIGLWYANHALVEYSYGTARRMGPGYFPAWVGCLMASLGAAIALLGLFRPGDVPRASLRPLLAIMGGGFAFAGTFEVLGLVPAVFLLVGIGTLADRPYRPLRTLALAAALSVLGVVLFSWGLGIPLHPFRWNP
ncbi:MAG: tripartite tricarboxylate transporter TctB family protein [Acetobacteraceae bacterium]|nr:tripartite tricarboxylate transporter TctB family protein [Acetobacteraceae bacterium]MDW8398230.1 tripartite tricarboxylate transporter TctB family protein [Acetobacteraceae bacterium]